MSPVVGWMGCSKSFIEATVDLAIGVTNGSSGSGSTFVHRSDRFGLHDLVSRPSSSITTRRGIDHFIGSIDHHLHSPDTIAAAHLPTWL